MTIINVHAAAARRRASSQDKDVHYQNLLNELHVEKSIVERFADNFVDTIAMSIGGFTLSQRKELFKTIVISLCLYLVDHLQYNSNEGFEEWTTSQDSTCDTVLQEAFTHFMIADSTKQKRSTKSPQAAKGNTPSTVDKENKPENPGMVQKQQRLSKKDRRNRCLAFRSFQQQHHQKNITNDSKMQ